MQKSKKQKIIKIISVVLLVVFWLLTLYFAGVFNGRGNFLYPENDEPSALRFICCIGYVLSFYFTVYNFCESKKLLIWYSICLGLTLLALCFAVVFNQKIIQNISAVIFAIIPLPTLILPFGLTFYFLNVNLTIPLLIIVLLFYPVYFGSRYIKKRRLALTTLEQWEDVNN